MVRAAAAAEAAGAAGYTGGAATALVTQDAAGGDGHAAQPGDTLGVRMVRCVAWGAGVAGPLGT